MEMVWLISLDGVIFVVDRAVAFMSCTIKNTITSMDDTRFESDNTFGTSDPVPLPNVSGQVLAKVIQYCKYHVGAINSNFEEWTNWLRDQQVRDREYFDVDRDALFYLIPEIVDQIKVARTRGLPNVSRKIQGKVQEYCNYKMRDADSDYEDWKIWADDVKVWDQQFVEVDAETYIDLVRAGKYLEIKNLLELTRKKYADIKKGKTTEEICEMLEVNLTPEEAEDPFTFEEK